MVFSTSTRWARFWRLLRVAILVPVVAVLGHDAVFAARFGLGRELAAAMSAGNHDGWWALASGAVLLLAGLVLVAELIGIVRLRRRAAGVRPRRGGETAARSGYLRELVTLWAVLLPAAAAAFVVQEELEHRAMGAAGHGIGILFGPEHPLALPVLAIVAGGAAALAALVRWRVRILQRRIAVGVPAQRPRRRPSAATSLVRWSTAPHCIPIGIVGLRPGAGRAPPASP